MRTNSDSLATVFDRLHSETHKKRLERWIVAFSLAGFAAHLLCIFLARNLPHPPTILAAAGSNYLFAIDTPFSFILFYEVLILISAIPQSTTRSISTQFEIVSLIFVRGFFKDIAALDLASLRSPAIELKPALVEVCAGLLMFLLVTVFQHAASGRSPRSARERTPAQAESVRRKQLIAMALTALFVSLAAIHLWNDGTRVFRETYLGEHGLPSSPATFYSDVFTVMIFTDVLILILSLLVSDRYELVFRNAAFVISTVLIRFALTAAQPYGAFLAVFGMLFAIVTVLIYNYSNRIKKLRDEASQRP